MERQTSLCRGKGGEQSSARQSVMCEIACVPLFLSRGPVSYTTRVNEIVSVVIGAPSDCSEEPTSCFLFCKDFFQSETGAWCISKGWSSSQENVSIADITACTRQRGTTKSGIHGIGHSSTSELDERLQDTTSNGTINNVELGPLGSLREAPLARTTRVASGPAQAHGNRTRQTRISSIDCRPIRTGTELKLETLQGARDPTCPCAWKQLPESTEKRPSSSRHRLTCSWDCATVYLTARRVSLRKKMHMRRPK